MQPIRTAASMEFSFIIPASEESMYEKLRYDIIELYRKVPNKTVIARQLGTTRRIVRYTLKKYWKE